MTPPTLQSVLKSQYHAALKTLRLTVEQCPPALWADPADGPSAYWRVAYHTLFYTHFYLSADQHAFVPWPKHRRPAADLGAPADRDETYVEPYSSDEILEYWRYCDLIIGPAVDALDLSATTCGFPWYTVGKLEHQFVNIRHIQHHTASLSTRLRLKTGILIPWIGKGEAQMG